ncbi:unnamed protein product [Caretta caretta]
MKNPKVWTSLQTGIQRPQLGLGPQCARHCHAQVKRCPCPRKLLNRCVHFITIVTMPAGTSVAHSQLLYHLGKEVAHRLAKSHGAVQARTPHYSGNGRATAAPVIAFQPARRQGIACGISLARDTVAKTSASLALAWP